MGSNNHELRKIFVQHFPAFNVATQHRVVSSRDNDKDSVVKFYARNIVCDFMKGT